MSTCRPEETHRVLEDPISPSAIEHRLEAAVSEETRELLYYYNYIRYQFDMPGGEIWARSYLDDIERVSLFLPKGMKITSPDAERVMGYLTLRFNKVDMLGQDGYVTIWPKNDGPQKVAG